MKQRLITIGLLLLLLALPTLGCATNIPKYLDHICIQGIYVGSLTPSQGDYYIVYLGGVPDRFDTVLCPRNQPETYNHAIFEAVNTFYLSQTTHGEWIITKISNENGTVGYWNPNP